MADLSQAVKAEILKTLDADPAITVPSQRIFPIKVAALPAYPFIRYDPPTVRPYENTCGVGIEADIRISVFTRGEDAMQALSAAIVTAVNGMGAFQSVDWSGTQLIPDPETDVFHAVIGFTVIHTD